MAKSTGSAVITFALVSVPVKMYTACAAEGVSFKMLTPAGNLIKQKVFDAVTGAEVSHGDCDKGYEVSKDTYIRITKDELKALEAECESKTVDIVEFVDAATVDMLQVEKSYYLGPDKGGDKGYQLLSEAMASQNRVAVAQWNARGKENLVVIRPYQGGLVLHQMFYASEVRPFEEIRPSGKSNVSDAERSMALKLLEALSGSAYDPTKFSDGYVARVKKAIDDKVNGGAIKTASAEAPATSNILDLTALLAKSLESAADKKTKK